MSLSGSLPGPAGYVTMWDMKLFLSLIGLLLVVEGLPYVAAPEAMQRWLRQLTELPPAHLRAIGLVAMGAGFILLYVVLRSGLLP